MSSPAADSNNNPNDVDQNEVDLQTLAKSCADEAEKLVGILDSLAVKLRDNGKRRLGAALRCVTRAKWKRSDIEKIQKNMESYQNQLDRTLLRIIRIELLPAEHHEEVNHLSRTNAPAVQIVKQRTVHHKFLIAHHDRRIQQTLQKRFSHSDRKLPKDET